MTGHTGSVTSLTVLKDGSLVSGSCDETINIWNAETGSIIKQLIGHTRFNIFLLVDTNIAKAL